MTPPTLDTALTRRQLNRMAWALALLPWQSAIAAAQTPVHWARNPFLLGVASGAPRPSSVVLWTRLMLDAEQLRASPALGPCEVRYEVFRDEALRERVAEGTVITDAARAHSVHVTVSGLSPRTRYWYRFSCGDATSPVGRTLTAPAPDTLPMQLRLALASCQHWEQGSFAAHRELATEALDAVIFVGDYIYESHFDGPAERRHLGWLPRTLDEYRQRHAQYKTDPDLQACHGAHPWILMWDDNEVLNDYAGDKTPRKVDAADFVRRRAAAYRAYYEHLPLARGPAPDGLTLPLADRFAFGRLVDLWTLDTRQFRSPVACPDPFRAGGRVVRNCAALDDPARSMLGAEAEERLTAELPQSQAVWKLLAQTTQLAPGGFSAPGVGRLSYSENWDGYPRARQRLLDTIAKNRIPGVVTLGGDMHHNLVAHLRQDADNPHSPIVASEIVTASVTSVGLHPWLLGAMKASHPDILHARADEHGYTLLEVTPETLVARFRSGPHPANRAQALHTQAEFQVQARRAGFVPLTPRPISD